MIASNQNERRKKPRFIRQQLSKKKLKLKWRKPKGIDSKLRLQKKGHRKRPRIGYGSTKTSKNLIEGFKAVIIHNLNDLKDIGPKSQAVLIAKSVGIKKKVELLKKIKILKINVLNIKDIDPFLKKIEEDLIKRKESKIKTEEKKKKLKEESEKKAIEKKKEEEKKEEDIEEKKKTEQEEKRRVYEKKTTKEGIGR